MTQSIEEKYPDLELREHVMEKDMWAGSSKILPSDEYIFKVDPSKRGLKRFYAVFSQLKYPPALFKCIDEPLVNSLDHLIRCLGSSMPVTWIKVKFEQSGWVHISNDGPGIEIAVHQKNKLWVPELIFGELFKGSNMRKLEDSIIGGTNGVGAKLSNIFGKIFIVETVDAERKKYYRQQWTDNMASKSAPLIVDLTPAEIAKAQLTAAQVASHTTLSFLPDYTGVFGYPEFNLAVWESLNDLFRTRTIYACAYAKYTVQTAPTLGIQASPINVYYNDENLPIESIADIAAIIYPGQKILKTLITPVFKPKTKSAIYRYPWEVCAVVVEQSESRPTQASNVNGVVVKEGKHTKHLYNLIQAGVKEKITKVFSDKNIKFSAANITNNIFLLANCKIPAAQWTGQRKDVLDLNIKSLAGYNFDNKFIADLTAQLKDYIIDNYFTSGEQEKTKRERTGAIYDKYKPARKSESKKPEIRRKCSLIMVEGDSALTQIVTGITNNPSMGFDYYGVISLGGVIINARKECSVIETANGRYIKKSTKLTDNKFINALMDFTGLNTKYNYDPASESYQKEISELKYGCIVGCVDQDYDGVGNIFGLVLNIFELYWPKLFAAGFIKRFETPSRRAYPLRDKSDGGFVEEFYNQQEYDDWITRLKATGLTDETIKTKFDIQYYKGLGTHSREETIQMFKNFEKHLFTYYIDEQSHEVFEIYFGDDPEKRKKELSRPIMPLPDAVIADQLATKRIKCDDHLRDHTFIYQKDNLDRKLDHAIDGMNQAGRKIYDGIYKAFRTSNKPLKVAQLGGYISEHESYHHGEGSLADSITGKAFTAVGGKQLPQIVPLSNFGSRKLGGKDAASARYIWTRHNKQVMNVLYPESDYYLLEFNFDEGVRTEPKYFVPIIPAVILDSNELPGHGWKLKVWGRDVFEVIKNVRRMIKTSDDIGLMKLPPNTYRFKGTIKTVRGEPFSFGKYEYNERKNTIMITELPLRVWTEDYVREIKKKEGAPDGIVARINDESDDLNVKIEVKLKPAGWDKLKALGGDSVWCDPAEEYLFLRSHMDSHLNFMGKSGEVLSFKSYEAVFYYWFPVRKQYYSMRIARQIKLLQLKILRLENIIRYVSEYKTIDAPGRKTTEIESRLSGANYNRFHKSRLDNPKFIKNEDLEAVILHSTKSNYDYLIDLSDRKKTSEAIADRIEELRELRDELAALEAKALQGRFPGAVIWEEELNQLEEMIKLGRETDWMYGDKKKFVFK